MFGFFAARITHVFSTVANELGTTEVTHRIMETFFTEVALFALASIPFLVATSFVVSMIFSHKVAGSSVGIIRFISQIKEGKYGLRRSLRNSDELKNIMKEVNELSDALAERHGPYER